MAFKPFKKEEHEKPRVPEKPSAPLKERVFPEVEKPPKPEVEKPEEEVTEVEEAGEVRVTPVAPPTPAVEKSETIKQIDSILFEGLDELYQSLPEKTKQEFRKKEAETATKIERFISQAKVAAHKIVELIKEFLKIIPGVNKFFLEQETKIKTGKILALAKKHKKE